MRVCINGTGASICGGGFCGVDWPKVIKAHRRFCIVSSAFVTAAARGGIWGVGGWEKEGWGGACPWLGEGQGMIEGRALGRGSCVKVSGDGPIISGVPTSPSASDSSRSSSTGSPTC